MLALIVAFFLISDRFGLYSKSLDERFPTFAYWYRSSSAFPVFGLLLLVFSRTRGWLTDRLAAPWMVYLGEISFSFYMIHRIVMLLLSRIELSREPLGLLASCGFSFFTSLLAASALYHLIELPFRKLIVETVERERSSKLIEMLSGALRDWLQPKRFAILCLLAMVSGAIALQYRIDDKNTAEIASIIASSPAPPQGTQAIEAPDLLGLARQPYGIGEVVFKLVWRIAPDESTYRYVRLMDGEGKVLASAVKPKELRNENDSEEVLIDRIIIPAKKLVNVDHVDVVLRTAESPSGNRSRKVRRQSFTLWRQDSKTLLR